MCISSISNFGIDILFRNYDEMTEIDLVVSRHVVTENWAGDNLTQTIEREEN